MKETLLYCEMGKPNGRCGIATRTIVRIFWTEISSELVPCCDQCSSSLNRKVLTPDEVNQFIVNRIMES